MFIYSSQLSVSEFRRATILLNWSLVVIIGARISPVRCYCFFLIVGRGFLPRSLDDSFCAKASTSALSNRSIFPVQIGFGPYFFFIHSSSVETGISSSFAACSLSSKFFMLSPLLTLKK